MYRLLGQFQDTVSHKPWLEERFGPNYDLPDDSWGLDWSPDGQFLASVHNDFALRIWDIGHQISLPVQRLTRRKMLVSVAWSPDGHWIVAGDTKADPVCVWNAHTGELVQELYEHDGWPLSLDWRGDGQYLVSGGMDGRVLLWHTATWQVIHKL